MQDFFANCATVLQKYGFSYLRGAGTTLLLALVGTFFGCLIGFAVGALQTIHIDKQRDPAVRDVIDKSCLLDQQYGGKCRLLAGSEMRQLAIARQSDNGQHDADHEQRQSNT